MFSTHVHDIFHEKIRLGKICLDIDINMVQNDTIR